MKDRKYTPGANPYLLQLALAKEMANIASDMRFHTPIEGKEDAEVPLNIYIQSLPVPQPDNSEITEETIDYIGGEGENAILATPWCNIKIDSGHIGKNVDPSVKIAFIFGIYNPDKQKTGYQEILVLIQRIYERFAKDPLLDGQYQNSGEYEWEIAEDDTYPYFFGVSVTEFTYLPILFEGGNEWDGFIQ